MVNSWAGRTICTPFGNGRSQAGCAGEESPAGGHPLPPCLHTGKAGCLPPLGPGALCGRVSSHPQAPLHVRLGLGPLPSRHGHLEAGGADCRGRRLFRELSVRQIHENGRVRLLIKTDLDGGADGNSHSSSALSGRTVPSWKRRRRGRRS